MHRHRFELNRPSQMRFGSNQTEANRLSDTAALFMALGGSWPAACTTSAWRECAMEDGPAPQNI
jgi:hypothetical protein